MDLVSNVANEADLNLFLVPRLYLFTVVTKSPPPKVVASILVDTSIKLKSLIVQH